MGTFGDYTGNMTIPQEKRKIFTEQISKVLNYGGMMQLEDVNMYGMGIKLLQPIEISSDKICNFHFNYFEDDTWETAGYKPKTGEFYSNKIGTAEFADVITAIHVLYEMHDEGYGVTTYNGEIIDSMCCVAWLNNLLGTRYSMKKRFSIWNIAEKYGLEMYIENRYKLNMKDVKDIIPDRLLFYAGGTELTDLLYIVNGTDMLTLDEIEQGSYSEDVYNCKRAIEAFLECCGENAAEKLRLLLSMDRLHRQEVRDSTLMEVARYTLILPARVIVYLYAELSGVVFWELWNDVRENVYHDETMKRYVSEIVEQKRQEHRNATISPLRTSEYLRQDEVFTFFETPKELQGRANYYLCDDDRLYWWDGTDEVIISAEMDDWLNELALRHKKITKEIMAEYQQEDFLQLFLSLLEEINQYYKRIFPFQSMFYEFLQKGSLIEYRAAIELLRELSEENKEDGKIIEKIEHSWYVASRNVTHNIGRLRLKRYLSVLANLELRKQYFGF